MMITIKITLTLIITLVFSFILFEAVSSDKAHEMSKSKRVARILLSTFTLILLIIVLIQGSFDSINQKNCGHNNYQSSTSIKK